MEIDLSYLKRTVGDVDLSGIETIAMDDFAIQKGHRYATVTIGPQRKQVLWLCRGRSREDVRPFFEQLGSNGRRQLKAVAMDMNGAYALKVRMRINPTAQFLYRQQISRELSPGRAYSS